jgi:Asp-tRNA(Asn)/Glu-tRNA(Gln) amidotransferase A subunit family amidase
VVTSSAVASNPRPLAGIRIAILREHMVKRTPNHQAIADQVDREIKTVLRDRLGAELIETLPPGYADDPEVPNVTFGFSDALSELLPRLMPELLRRRDASGRLLFAVPGHDVTSYDYLKALSRRQAPLTERFNILSFAAFGAQPCYASPTRGAYAAGIGSRADANALCNDVAFDIDRYLAERKDRTIRTFADWVARARFKDDASRAGAENWAALPDHSEPGKAERLARSYLGRMALERMMAENGIAAFVHAENTVPTPTIQGPNVGDMSLDGITPFLQIPRIVVPAGMNAVVVEPRYALNQTKTDYISVIPPGTAPSTLPHPMPIALTFFAGQGDEPTLIRIGTAYEAATHHRTPPPAFGPVKARPTERR